MPTRIMKTKSLAKIPPIPLGASDLLAFIDDWGHPEWVVVAAEAPVNQVSRLLAPAHRSKQVLHHVPIRPARKQDKEIAPFVTVAQCAPPPLCGVLGRDRSRQVAAAVRGKARRSEQRWQNPGRVGSLSWPQGHDEASPASRPSMNCEHLDTAPSSVSLRLAIRPCNHPGCTILRHA